MVVVTADQLKGRHINKVVRGVEAVGIESVTLYPINDGEISRGIEVACREALRNLSEEAHRLGSDAVVSVRLQVVEMTHVLEVLNEGPHLKTRVTTGGRIEVIAKGEAVVTEDDNETSTSDITDTGSIASGINSVLYESNNEIQRIYDEASKELQKQSMGTVITDIQESTCHQNIRMNLLHGRVSDSKVFSVLLYGTATTE